MNVISIFSMGYCSREALDFFIVFLVLTQYIFEDKFGIPFLYSWSLLAAFSLFFVLSMGLWIFNFHYFGVRSPVGWGRTHIFIVMES